MKNKSNNVQPIEACKKWSSYSKEYHKYKTKEWLRDNPDYLMEWRLENLHIPRCRAKIVRLNKMIASGKLPNYILISKKSILIKTKQKIEEYEKRLSAMKKARTKRK
ncbi:MAG: hypothetical protein LBV22_00440 [Mycoplasmataceae bacterium]|nr:hypothetical protein [Mycoplasmataceae bacterium]